MEITGGRIVLHAIRQQGRALAPPCRVIAVALCAVIVIKQLPRRLRLCAIDYRVHAFMLACGDLVDPQTTRPKQAWGRYRQQKHWDGTEAQDSFHRALPLRNAL